MAFVSDLQGQLVIDDVNWQEFASPHSTPDGLSRGYIPRDYEQFPEGAFAAPFDLPVIPRSEWTDRIEEMERTKTRLSDLRRQAGMKSLNQNGTNYCWANGPTTCMQLIRLVNGQPFVELSPASVAAPIKGYRNVGGWGSQALEYIVEHGICSTEHWPANAINRKYDNAESRANRELHKVPEWWELRARSFDQLMTCLLLRIPVAVGYNWWSHEVCGIDPVVISANKYGARILNSWGDGWEDRGEAVLAESKATPDDAVAPRVVTPSEV